MCIFIYTCMYIFTYINIDIGIYIYTSKHMYIYKYICVHTYIYTYTHTYTNMNISSYQNKSTPIYIPTLDIFRNRYRYRCTYIYVHMYIWRHIIAASYTWSILIFMYMGWPRWIGSLKLLVSFAKEPCKRDCSLQKRPLILRSLLIVEL